MCLTNQSGDEPLLAPGLEKQMLLAVVLNAILFLLIYSTMINGIN